MIEPTRNPEPSAENGFTFEGFPRHTGMGPTPLEIELANAVELFQTLGELQVYVDPTGGKTNYRVSQELIDAGNRVVWVKANMGAEPEDGDSRIAIGNAIREFVVLLNRDNPSLSDETEVKFAEFKNVAMDLEAKIAKAIGGRTFEGFSAFQVRLEQSR